MRPENLPQWVWPGVVLTRNPIMDPQPIYRITNITEIDLRVQVQILDRTQRQSFTVPIEVLLTEFIPLVDALTTGPVGGVFTPEIVVRLDQRFAPVRRTAFSRILEDEED